MLSAGAADGIVAGVGWLGARFGRNDAAFDDAIAAALMRGKSSNATSVSALLIAQTGASFSSALLAGVAAFALCAVGAVWAIRITTAVGIQEVDTRSTIVRLQTTRATFAVAVGVTRRAADAENAYLAAVAV